MMIIEKMITTVDLHVSGEPLRIITDGFPEIKGNTQLEKRQYCMEHLDEWRKILMFEPRGHHGMYGCIITPPSEPGSDFGVLFMHNEGWSTMCGHGIIAVVTMGIETGRFEVTGDSQTFVIDSPAGKVIATANVEKGRVKSVSFENVPSFVLEPAIQINVDGVEIEADIAFGGAFYIITDSKQLGLSVSKKDLPALQKWGTKIKKAVEAKYEIVHPEEEKLTGIYGVIFSDEPQKKNSDLRNVTIFADEQVDRSPCGTGTSARLASLHCHQRLNKGDLFIHESITDGQFTGEILEETVIANYKGVVPRVEGTAYITGLHQFVIDPEDELPRGFLLEEK